MSGTKCKYINCGKSAWNTPGLKMHRFPADVNISKKWIENCGNGDLLKLSSKKLKDQYICENHFSKTCYKYSNPRRLFPHAVPENYKNLKAPIRTCSTVEEESDIHSDKEGNFLTHKESPELRSTALGNIKRKRKEHKNVQVSEVTSVSSEGMYKLPDISCIADKEEKKKKDQENGTDDDDVEFQDDQCVKEEPFLQEIEEVMLSASEDSDDNNIEPGRNYCTFLRKANEAFGVFVAERLNKMNDQQRLLCEDLITQITSSAIKQKLTANTRICELPVAFNFE